MAGASLVDAVRGRRSAVARRRAQRRSTRMPTKPLGNATAPHRAHARGDERLAGLVDPRHETAPRGCVLLDVHTGVGARSRRCTRRRRATVSRLPAASRAPLGWLGLAAIGVAATTFSGSTPFPGYAALLPTVGTALVIAAGLGDRTPRLGVGRLLAVAPMRYIGDRSYCVLSMALAGDRHRRPYIGSRAVASARI